MAQFLNFSPNSWESLKLVQKLIQIDAHAWYDIECQIDEIAPLLGWRPIGLEEYTDHDLNHCFRILQALSNIIPDGFQFNQNELEILIYAILLHDLGMWTARSEVDNAINDNDFVNYLRETKQYDLILKYLNSSSKEEQYIGKLLLRPAVAVYHRQHHAERTKNILNATAKDVLIQQRIHEEFLPIIGLICAAHDWPLDQVLKSDQLDVYRISNSRFGNSDEDLQVDVRLLAVLLRIGDLLDLDQKRISRIIRSYLDNLSPVAEAHWRKHETLRFKKMNADIIEIIGNFNYDRYGKSAADAYFLAKEWCRYLEQEVNVLKIMLNQPERYGLRSGRKMGELLLDINGLTSTGIIFTENLSFIMDKQRIFEILGDEIYEDKSAFIRELLQNSIDATRTRIVSDYMRGEYPQYTNLDLRSPNMWPREITEQEKYAIRIKTGTEVYDDKELLYFEISDNGIGMTVQQIRSYFLQVGKSFYRSGDFSANYKHNAISRFGIGFLSCLLIAKKIIVHTKSLESDSGIKLDINSNSDNVSAFVEEGLNVGTKIKIMFEPEIVDDTGWISNEQMNEKVFRLFHPHLYCNSKLISAIYFWLPWNELSIYVNSDKLKPCSPLDLVTNEKYWTFPYRVVAAESQELLGTGNVVIEKKTVVPYFNLHMDEELFWPSIGGIAIPPWEKNQERIMYLDIYRQPESVLTASRRAKFELPSAPIKKEIVEDAIHEIDNILNQDGDEIYRALFRASIEVENEDMTLLLPVIRNNKFIWEEWDRKRFRVENCILAPFFVPFIYKDLAHDLPIVGVPRRKSNCPRDILPRIKDVRAISLNDKFTAALYAQSRYVCADEITNGYTYLLYRFSKYESAKNSWTAMKSNMASQEPIRQQMMPWDIREDNLWESLGFDPLNSQSWQLALHYCHNVSNIKRSLETMKPFDVVVSLRNWNKLEKAKTSSQVANLLRYLLSDDE